MNMINLVSVVIVLFATGTGVGSIALRALEPLFIPRARQFVPAVRVRWLVVLLGVPLALGSLAVVVAFGPCLRNLALGLPDGCRDHGGPEFFFCLRTATYNVPFAWGLAGGAVLLTLRGMFSALRSLMRAHRAVAVLKRVGRWDDALDLWVVPGMLAMVAGFPEPEIFLGEEIAAGVSRTTLDAVLAHERAHKRRRDLLTKLFARALAAIGVQGLVTRLLEELDLAIEQACDAAAADEMRDPVLVARSLVDLAGARDLPNEWACAFGSVEHLEARVRALCEPRWRSSGRTLGASIAVALSIVGACAVLDPKLHDVVEAVFGRVLGG